MNIAIKNASGMLENIIVVRYFNFNGANYLIFTKNEIDEAGYQKLYISKITNMMGDAISDEVEWNLVRDTIKVIAKANKENTNLPVQDLNEAEINGIQVIGQKPFKLTSTSVSLLGANKNAVSNMAAPILQNVAQPMPTMDAAVAQPSVAPASSIVPPFSGQGAEVTSSTTPVVDNVVPFASAGIDSMVSPVETSLPNVAPSPVETSLPNVAPSPVMDSMNNMQQPLMETSGISTDVMPAPVMPGMNTVVPTTPVAPITVDNGTAAEITSSIGTPLPQVSLENIVPMDNPTPLQESVVSNDLFNFPSSTVTPTEPMASEPTVDYKKLYDEQTLKLNSLTTELEKYKNIIEQLKNILK